MPTYLHPGVYVEETAGGSKPIEGVATAIAAFVGHTTQGPIGEAVPIHRWADYEETFGGVLSSTDTLGLAVSAYYQNGGKSAYVARLTADAEAATWPQGAASMPGLAGGVAEAINVLVLRAKSAGAWGNELHVQVTGKGDKVRFKLEVGRMVDGVFEAEETFDDLTMIDRDVSYAVTVVNGTSNLITAELAPEIVADPSTFYRRGASQSRDLTGFDWTQVTEGMTLSLAVDGMGIRTITLGAAPGGGYDTVDEVIDEIQARVRELGPENGYAGFTCTESGGFLRLQSGTIGAIAAVVVQPGELATLLQLGKAMGGSEGFGTLHIVPQDLAPTALADGADGVGPSPTDYERFFARLEKVRDVSMVLCPGEWLAADGSGNPVLDRALAHCERTASRVLILDPPPTTEFASAADAEALGAPSSSYSALYYPWVKVANPEYDADTNPAVPTTLTVAPSGFAAGMWSKIDGRRGVWKAPAGVETALLGVAGLEFVVEDGEQDQLNPLGFNCLRRMPGFGSVMWGARTLATKAVPQWRYVPVRRTAILIERSIYEGIQWAVFEPNNHLLWASLKASVGGFMDGLFRAGAFQGEKASDAYFVRCGLGDTMTQDDIDRGQVIVVVGFAPLKPAEFVIVRIQQKVGQE